MRFLKRVLLGLHIITGIGGVAGGLACILEPDRPLGVSVTMLRNSPFDNFLIPGILLFSVIGIGNLIGAAAIVFKIKVQGYISGFFSVALISWIIVQCVMIETIVFMHVLFFIIGVLSGLISLLIVSNKVSQFLRLVLSYLYDLKQYWKYSLAVRGNKNIDNLLARITIHYHSIEKALTLKETRVGFGKQVVESLLDGLDEYKTRGFDLNRLQVKAAVSALFEYVKFHEDNNYKVDEVKERLKDYEYTGLGGVVRVNKEELIEAGKSGFKEFCEKRFSVRDFEKNCSVDICTIIESIKIAQKTPSVCNRQAFRVFVVQNQEDKAVIEEMQNGNRGFADLVDKYLLVTGDLSYFVSVGERNQAYVDAGMFGMSLVNALHYHGVGTCCLNWCVEGEQDKRFKKRLNIPENQVIALIIAVGHYSNSFIVAKSTRIDVHEMTKIL